MIQSISPKILNVVFDYNVFGRHIVIATLIYDGALGTLPDYKKVVCRPLAEDNQYVSTLMAFESAGKYASEVAAQLNKDSATKNVKCTFVISHQNQTLMTWIRNQSCNPKYSALLERSLEPWKSIAIRNDLGLRKITKQDNQAKKFCVKPQGIETDVIETLNWKITESVKVDSFEDEFGNQTNSPENEGLKENEGLSKTGTDNVVSINRRVETAVNNMNKFGPKI